MTAFEDIKIIKDWHEKEQSFLNSLQYSIHSDAVNLNTTVIC